MIRCMYVCTFVSQIPAITRSILRKTLVHSKVHRNNRQIKSTNKICKESIRYIQYNFCDKTPIKETLMPLNRREAHKTLNVQAGEKINIICRYLGRLRQGLVKVILRYYITYYVYTYIYYVQLWSYN